MAFVRSGQLQKRARRIFSVAAGFANFSVPLQTALFHSDLGTCCSCLLLDSGSAMSILSTLSPMFSCVTASWSLPMVTTITDSPLKARGKTCLDFYVGNMLYSAEFVFAELVLMVFLDGHFCVLIQMFSCLPCLQWTTFRAVFFTIRLIFRLLRMLLRLRPRLRQYRFQPSVRKYCEKPIVKKYGH